MQPILEDFVDLEIRIFKREADGYPIEMTLRGQQHFPRGFLAADILPWISGGDLAADGQRLFAALLADSVLRDAWAEARGQAPRRRIRLSLDPAAPELHTLPWEQLREEDVLLAANANTPLSRYLPIRLRWGSALVRRPLRMLVAISAPDDLERYNLAPIDSVRERTALEALGSSALEVTFLDPPLTLERLESALRQGIQILHYVGHGAFNTRHQRAVLYLQDEAGRTQPVADADLAQMLARQGVQPHLVFLAACQSATRSTIDAFVGLGPGLVNAGVPAVVAMQDAVTIKTARKLSEVFYQRLTAHGVVDLAMNEARSTLVTAERPDAAVPVLFMRLQDGKLFALRRSPWEALLSRFVAFVSGRPARMALVGASLAVVVMAGVWGARAYLNRGWRAIPGGQALLGSPEHYCNYAVESFEIQRTEVTNADYLKCVRAGECAPPISLWTLGPEDWIYPAGQEQHAVWGVFWKDADAYCRYIDARLPTEAEWVRAARRGSLQDYPWGDDFAVEYANVFESGIGDAVAVTMYPLGRSRDRLYNMAGNAREWTADQAKDPCDFMAGEGEHVIKGGSFKDRAQDATIWLRYEGDTLPFVGIRCARDRHP